MEGNFFNSRGMYTEAVASYLKAQPYSGARAYAEFGLGAVYVALEEGGIALERFQAAQKALQESSKPAYPELVYRIQYNIGVVHFKEGDYPGAVEAFRAALGVDGQRIEAKRNLELSLLSLAQKQSQQTVSQEPRETPEFQDKTSAVFDYLRQKELHQWKSREWVEDSAVSGPDY
ncbi:MAG: tetratricopeptide repeat protein [Spirochaetaceae bacterium]|jgi:Ca-activated chloride channel family protein|nr:tetratricopeptide repeat protein [Spirochaetaceae bacterium]